MASEEADEDLLLIEALKDPLRERVTASHPLRKKRGDEEIEKGRERGKEERATPKRGRGEENVPKMSFMAMSLTKAQMV